MGLRFQWEPPPLPRSHCCPPFPPIPISPPSPPKNNHHCKDGSKRVFMAEPPPLWGGRGGSGKHFGV